MLIERLSWDDARKLADRVLLVPLGSLEQHGPHLPLLTDTAIVSEISQALEKSDEERVVLVPTVWLGHSPHHRRFVSVSLDLRPYIEMICGLCQSLVALGAKKILLLNGHGGNDIPCNAALRQLKSALENRPDVYIVYATYWNLAAREFSAIRTSPHGGMGHAGEMETSIMQVIHPELVRMERASADGPFNQGPYRVSDMLAGQPYHLVNEFDEISRTGTIGMPEHASREKGDGRSNGNHRASGSARRQSLGERTEMNRVMAKARANGGGCGCCEKARHEDGGRRGSTRNEGNNFTGKPRGFHPIKLLMGRVKQDVAIQSFPPDRTERDRVKIGASLAGSAQAGRYTSRINDRLFIRIGTKAASRLLKREALARERKR